MIVRSGPRTTSAWAGVAVPALLAAQGSAASGQTSGTSPWVAAGAGILGAVLGGSVTGFVTLRAEDKRHDHARELADLERKQRRDDAELVARGIGQLLRDDLKGALAKAQTTLDKPAKISAAAFAPRLATEDRKILARYLTREEYDAVADAEIRAEQISAYLVAHKDEELSDPGKLLLEDSVPKIEQGETALTSAIERFESESAAGSEEPGVRAG